MSKTTTTTTTTTTATATTATATATATSLSSTTTTTATTTAAATTAAGHWVVEQLACKADREFQIKLGWKSRKIRKIISFEDSKKEWYHSTQKLG